MVGVTFPKDSRIDCLGMPLDRRRYTLELHHLPAQPFWTAVAKLPTSQTAATSNVGSTSICASS